MAERAERPAVAGVVLAGGASRRMGQPKATLLLDGEPLLRRAVRLLGEALPEVIVVGDPAFSALVSGTPLFADRYPGRGPLGGLATAFAVTAAPWVFLMACDMPLLSPPLVLAMVDRALSSRGADAVVLPGPKGPEPLHACYARHVMPTVEERIAADDWSMGHLLGRLTIYELSDGEWARVDPQRRSTTNANTPEEWAEVQRWHAEDRLAPPPLG